MNDTKAEEVIDARFDGIGGGVTLVFTLYTKGYDWLHSRRDTYIFNKYYVSPRGGGAYIGVRRKSPHE